ncbi:LytR/AlgR family response regulator transcription factor [Mucilaginibacter ginsenosidivorans]|uniref:Response regulator transcription factor n=1 Tax=Mucilaginibacter ginsenosidivorans TaxID=398053 RepID=A0A5B8V090_9SPHI|nr:LytTR family DNA-binding domain-containing protein [Mucilaginibacter ginsenosidivorans]QEC64917.1 response regulator transcription factor [Mucilaginibacter ginsenosidivorans]
MTLNCVIIDDEPIARKLLQEYIEETDFLKLVGTAENPLKAVGLLSAQDVDLIYLDINMPKMSGMEFLRSTSNLPMVIMTTAYEQYALEGFEMAVIDYLVKPFPLERFLKASQKALEYKLLKEKKTAETPDGKYIFVKSDGKLERVVLDELIYVQAMSNYVILQTTRAKLIVYLTVKGILESLPPDKFIQVHKSYIMNINMINSINGNTIYIGNEQVPIGQSFYDGLMDKILKGKFLKR